MENTKWVSLKSLRIVTLGIKKGAVLLGGGVIKYYLLLNFSGIVHFFVLYKISSFSDMGLSGGILGRSQEGTCKPISPQCEHSPLSILLSS